MQYEVPRRLLGMSRFQSEDEEEWEASDVEEESLSDTGSEYSNPIEELLMHLDRLAEEDLVELPSNDSREGVISRAEAQLSNLGPADRFAVAVSFFSTVVLFFIFLSRFSRALHRGIHALAGKASPLSLKHVPAAPAGTEAAEVFRSTEDPPNKVAPESMGEAEDTPQAPAPPGGPGKPPGEDTENKEDLLPRPPLRKMGGGLMSGGPLDTPRKRLLALSPKLLKEERKLRRLEEALLLMELGRPPNPGPDEFVLGVLSRVLDIQHLGRHSDA